MLVTVVLHRAAESKVGSGTGDHRLEDLDRRELGPALVRPAFTRWAPFAGEVFTGASQVRLDTRLHGFCAKSLLRRVVSAVKGWSKTSRLALHQGNPVRSVLVQGLAVHPSIRHRSGVGLCSTGIETSDSIRLHSEVCRTRNAASCWSKSWAPYIGLGRPPVGRSKILPSRRFASGMVLFSQIRS